MGQHGGGRTERRGGHPVRQRHAPFVQHHAGYPGGLGSCLDLGIRPCLAHHPVDGLEGFQQAGGLAVFRHDEADAVGGPLVGRFILSAGGIGSGHDTGQVTVDHLPEGRRDLGGPGRFRSGIDDAHPGEAPDRGSIGGRCAGCGTAIGRLCGLHRSQSAQQRCRQRHGQHLPVHPGSTHIHTYPTSPVKNVQKPQKSIQKKPALHL